MDSGSVAPDRVAAGAGRRWRAGPLPEWLAPALVVALAYYLAAHLGFALTLKPHPISTLWPPNALVMAVLLLAPTRAWWWLLIAVLPAHLGAELASGVPTAMVIGWYLSNCSEALIGAALVRAFVPGPLRLDSLRTVWIFLACGALVAPLLSSFLDAALVRWIGWGEAGYWSLVRSRFFANVLAELTIVPLILAWAACSVARLREASSARYAEATLLFAGLFCASLVVFDLPQAAAKVPPAMFYLPLPFLLWAAMRFGLAGTASATALVTVATIWGAAHGLGPFAGSAPQDMVRDMQMFLVAVAVPMLLLTVGLEERLRVEGEAHEQRRQLTHLSRVAVLGELSGGIAHELNQPLTAILSNAQAAQHFIARKKIDPEVLDDILRDIISADQRASEVIRRLHALFRRGETLFQPLDVNELVVEVLGIAHGDLVTRMVHVESRLGTSLPAVQGDRVELQQVMLNLVLNACESMSSAKPAQHRRLVIRTRVKDGYVRVSFVDNGPGFTLGEYEKLFEPFYTTKPQGLGLGLSISRAIVRAHRGRLWGAAGVGRGAAFQIALPALAGKG